ncbi:MAG: hypothetical protein ACU0CI_00070 [Shimia sp.]
MSLSVQIDTVRDHPNEHVRNVVAVRSCLRMAAVALSGTDEQALLLLRAMLSLWLRGLCGYPVSVPIPSIHATNWEENSAVSNLRISLLNAARAIGGVPPYGEHKQCVELAIADASDAIRDYISQNTSEVRADLQWIRDFERECLRFDLQNADRYGPDSVLRLKLYEGAVFLKNKGWKYNTWPWPYMELQKFDRAWWAGWLEALWQGKPIDVDFAVQVAQIDEDIWEEGFPAVEAEIERLHALAISIKSLEAKAWLAERITLDTWAGKLASVPIDVEAPGLIAPLLDEVQDALHDATEVRNGLRPDDGIHRVLTRMLDRQRDNPQRIEISCTKAATELRHELTVSFGLPDDSAHRMLLASVEDLGRAVRAHHKDVAAHRASLVEQQLAELREDEAAAIEGFRAVVEETASEDLYEEVAIASEVLIAERGNVPRGGAPLVGSADAAARITHTALGMKDIYERFTESGAAALDHKTTKTIRAIGVYYRMATGLGFVVRTMLRIFGFL